MSISACKNNDNIDVPRLESMLHEIQAERRVRLDILRMEDMVPRRFKRRPRPKTAIISYAAKVAANVSEYLQELRTETESIGDPKP